MFGRLGVILGSVWSHAGVILKPYWGVIGHTSGGAEGADDVREAPKAPTKALPTTRVIYRRLE